jgi:hypothetical protein
MACSRHERNEKFAKFGKRERKRPPQDLDIDENILLTWI